MTGISGVQATSCKNVRIKERARRNSALESFNALNHVQFDVPNTTPVNAAFGSVTLEKGHGQRQITLGVKVLF